MPKKLRLAKDEPTDGQTLVFSDSSGMIDRTACAVAVI